jgi:hypothetical protein
MWANFDESWPFQPLNPGCPTSITPFLSSQPLPPRSPLQTLYKYVLSEFRSESALLRPLHEN